MSIAWVLLGIAGAGDLGRRLHNQQVPSSSLGAGSTASMATSEFGRPVIPLSRAEVDAEPARNRRQSLVERPAAGSRQTGGHEQMHIDPPQAATHHTVCVDELQYLVVRSDRHLRQRRQERQDFVATLQAPAGEFPDDEGLAEDLAAFQAGEARRALPRRK